MPSTKPALKGPGKPALKGLAMIRKAPPMHWVGDGFPVRSMFTYDDAAEQISPFLLLDYAPPTQIAPSKERRGVGEHPHRGFETVTIVFQGEVEHRDSAGHQGKIGPGDVQWMTAASGVVHEEKHSSAFARSGGTIEMAQLWVNLPKQHKMSPPAYQDILGKSIPEVALPSGAGAVRIIAGSFGGATGPARTFTPVNLWTIDLKANHSADLPLPEGHTAALLVRHGAVAVDAGETVAPMELALFDRAGGGITLRAESDASMLLMSGEPIAEPVVGYGPFVMNSKSEISDAIRDYQSGKMGHLDA